MITIASNDARASTEEIGNELKKRLNEKAAM